MAAIWVTPFGLDPSTSDLPLVFHSPDMASRTALVGMSLNVDFFGRWPILPISCCSVEGQTLCDMDLNVKAFI